MGSPLRPVPRLIADRTARDSRLLKIAGALVVISASVAYLIAIHLLTASGAAPGLALTLALAPLALMATAAIVRVAGPFVAAALVLAATVVAWILWPALVANVNRIYVAEHVAMNLFLCALFASSLVRPREALVTRLARLTRGGTLPERAVPYTRAVTLAWAIFFATVATVSALLFVWAPIAVWSLFANLLTWPLVVAMFAIEYAIRLRRLSDLEHVSILRSLYAFRHRRAAPPSPGKSP